MSSVFRFALSIDPQLGWDREAADGMVQSPMLLVWGEGDEVQAVATDSPARVLLVSGAPLNAPIARHGPLVMNTRAEIEQTLKELQQGTFPP